MGKIRVTGLLVIFLTCLVVSGDHTNHRNIFLSSGTIDTLSTPDFSSCDTQSRFVRDSSELQLRWLFHLRGPITESIKREVEASLGVQLGAYVPHNTFVVLATREQANRAQNTPHVLWVGSFLPEYKVSEGIRLFEQDLKTGTKIFADNLLHVIHEEFPSSEARTAAFNRWTSKLSDLPQNMKATFEPRTSKIALVRFSEKLSTETLSPVTKKLTELHDITYVEPVSFLSATSKWTTRFTEEAEPDFNSEKTVFKTSSLTGKTQIVAIADTGVEQANCFFPNKTNVDCQFNKDHCSEKLSHGTAMAGLIYGNPQDAAAAPFAGFAPDATGTVFSLPFSGNDGVEDKVKLLAGQLETLFQAAAHTGSRVFVIGYTGDVPYYDLFASEVDRVISQNKLVLCVLPAGNGGLNGVKSPGLSKNALIVGSTQNAVEGLRNDRSKIPAGGNADNVFNPQLSKLFGKDVLSSFSSRGPTSDKRFKPDVVFPGELVYTANVGNCQPSAVTGTSFAAAGAAGAAVLVRDYLANSFYPGGAANSGGIVNPTSAQVKAIMIASTVPVSSGDQGPLGTLNKVSYFDGSPVGPAGFGRVQLSNILYIEGTETKPFFFDQNSTVSVHTGETRTYCFSVNATGIVKVTLVWNDPEAITGSPFTLVNNLDLVVVDRKTGRQFKANGLETFDNTNNVEVVQFQATEAGNYTAYVHGTNVPVLGPQAYAIVISGDATIAGFDANCGGVTMKCPNLCSSNGVCDEATGLCKCQDGYFGPDCSITRCPGNCQKDATLSRGTCDLVSGKCICAPRFTGAACDKVEEDDSQIYIDTFEGRTKTETIIGVVVGCVGGICLGLILGFFVSKIIMEKQRKKRREQLLKGHQKF